MPGDELFYNLPGSGCQDFEAVDGDIEQFIHFEEHDNIPRPIQAILEDVAHLGIHVGEIGYMDLRELHAGIGKAEYHPDPEMIHYGTGGFGSAIHYREIGKAVMASGRSRDDVDMQFRNDNPASGIEIIG